VPRRHVYLKDLPENHLLKIKSVKFNFTDYKVFEKLACYPYERMIIQCANNYGADYMFKNAECHDLAKFFMECINTHGAFALQKQIEPEYFAENQYSREKPNFHEM
jgi:hypothetical protein